VVRLFAFLSLTLVAIALGLAPRADAKPQPAAAPAAAPDTIRVGIMSGMFKGVPEPLVKAGGQQFSGLFQKFTGLPGEVEVENDYRALANKLNQNKIQLGVVHGFEWAWLIKQNPDLAALVVTVPAKMPQACIVVNTKNLAMNPGGLKGANVDIPFNMKAHGFLYIEKLLKSSAPNAFVPNTPEDLGPEETLDELVKAKTAAVLVDSATLQAYQKNNPGLAKKLRVLCTSEVFPPTVILYSKKGLAEKSISQIRTGMLKADKEPSGKAFLFLWNLRGFEEPTAAFNKLVEDSLKAYPPPQPK
jgi:ABC-type phosphate/phosphonate transport system substrate-binding protein